MKWRKWGEGGIPGIEWYNLGAWKQETSSRPKGKYFLKLGWRMHTTGAGDLVRKGSGGPENSTWKLWAGRGLSEGFFLLGTRRMCRRWGEPGRKEASWEVIQKKSDKELTEVAGMVKRPVIIATWQHEDLPGMNNLDLHSLHVKMSRSFMCAVFSHSVKSDSVTPWTVVHQAPLSMVIL